MNGLLLKKFCKKEKEVIYFVNNKQMLAYWMQIEMGKIFKTMQITTIFFNSFFFPFFI